MLQLNTYSTAGGLYFTELPFYILSSLSLPIYGAALSLVWLLFMLLRTTNIYRYKTIYKWQN